MLVTAWLTTGCDKKADPAKPADPPPASTPTPATLPASPDNPFPSTLSPRVASLVPSVTDLLLGMGLSPHLVAVSNYCKANPGATTLPAVGDYLNTDWERLAAVRPDYLIVFVARSRVPEGMTQRAQDLGMTIENVSIETVADVLSATNRLGDLTGEPARARAARAELEQKLADIRRRYATKKPVPTLLAFAEGTGGISLAGKGTFLDELLAVAGGTNPAGELGKYPTIDNERLASLRFEKVLVLMPSGREAQARAAVDAWKARGVSEDRVVVLRDWYLLLPGWHLPDIAERFGEALHGGHAPEQGAR